MPTAAPLTIVAQTTVRSSASFIGTATKISKSANSDAIVTRLPDDISGSMLQVMLMAISPTRASQPKTAYGTVIRMPRRSIVAPATIAINKPTIFVTVKPPPTRSASSIGTNTT